MIKQIAICTLVLAGCRDNRAGFQPVTAPKIGHEQTEGGRDDRWNPDIVEHYAPDRPKAVIRFEPLDLTTAVPGASPLRVTVDNLGERVGDNTLHALRDQIRLYTWPDLAAIDTTLVEHDVDRPKYGPNGGERQDVADVQISPDAPLAARWYVLKLDGALPKGIDLPLYGMHYKFDDGSVGSRFAIGSDPRLVGVRVCFEGADYLGPERYVVAVDFSERVNVQAVREGRVVVSIQDETCPLEDGGITSIDSARFVCPDVSEPVDVAIYGLRGVDGPTDTTGVKVSTVRTTAAPEGSVPGEVEELRYQLDYATMTVWGDGCKIYRP